MALFKILKGNKQDLPSTKTEGYAYITKDEHKMYIDTSSTERIALNADLADRISYGTCTTAADTATKVVSLTDENVFNQVGGKMVAVQFTYTNTAANPTLSIGGTAAAIKRLGSSAPGTDIYGSWSAGSTVLFIYDGTNWRIVSISDNTLPGVSISDSGNITANKFIGNFNSTNTVTAVTGIAQGSLPTLTYTYDAANERMIVSWSAGSLPSVSSTDVAIKNMA